jgi:hypothetical protein
VDIENELQLEITASPNASSETVVSAEKKLSEWIQENAQCLWCGSRLHLVHVTHFAKNFTEESKMCPECGGKRGQQSHPLH